MHKADPTSAIGRSVICDRSSRQLAESAGRASAEVSIAHHPIADRRFIMPTVFLIDADNTLLDNVTIVSDLRRALKDAVGGAREARYWELFQQLWDEVGYADYFGALQRLRTEEPGEQRLGGVARFLLEYPFADRVYPGAFEAVAALQRIGRVVVLSDGDTVYQPNKIARSGLHAAVGGHVLIYVHKEEMLGDIERRYPATDYVVADDKLKILAAIKEQWRDRVTTVFVRQGNYAHDPAIIAAYPPADMTIERIADLQTLDWNVQRERPKGQEAQVGQVEQKGS
jgi:FMN phosphatase YigB (HAD superfamily)